MFAPVVRIAAQALPGEAGDLRVFDAVVVVRHPPAKFRHSRPHFITARICGRMFLRINGCREVPDCASRDASEGSCDHIENILLGRAEAAVSCSN